VKKIIFKDVLTELENHRAMDLDPYSKYLGYKSGFSSLNE
jgi:hypothetical protein